MSDNDLIRLGDALAAAEYNITDDDDRMTTKLAIRALPTATVGVKPLVWALQHNGNWYAWPYEIKRIEGYYIVYGWPSGTNPYDTADAAKAAAQADYAARILAALDAPAAHVNETPKTEHDAANMLTAQPALAFGEGRLVIDTGTVGSKPAVFIAPATMPGEVGASAKREGKPLDRLTQGEVYMTFPTEDQAKRVADALCNTPTPALADALGWMKGEPPRPWRDEWFIAKTIHGEKVVLRSLPEGWTYDYTTADHTYMIAENIVGWMQFPDSEYLAPPPAQPALAEALAVPEIAALLGDMLEFLRGLPPDASSGGHCNRDLRARIKQAMLGQSPIRAIGERADG